MQLPTNTQDAIVAEVQKRLTARAARNKAEATQTVVDVFSEVAKEFGFDSVEFTSLKVNGEPHEARQEVN